MKDLRKKRVGRPPIPPVEMSGGSKLADAEINMFLARYNRTGNALALWAAFRVCLQHDRPLPDGMKQFFRKIADKLLQFSDDAVPQARDLVADLVLETQNEGGGPSVFERYKTEFENQELYEQTRSAMMEGGVIDKAKPLSQAKVYKEVAAKGLHARWPDREAALREKLALGEDELGDWRDAVLYIPTGVDPRSGLYEQFAGYYALEPLDLTAYADRTAPIDVVIGRERTQRSQVVKQSDVVALIALLPEEFPGGLAETNFRYYEPRCAHGSSLSPAFHALVAARLGDADMALRYFRATASLDLAIDFDPNTAGGVRIAALGGLWQAVLFGFAGLDMRNDALGLDPMLPPQWRSLSFRVRWRGRTVAIHIKGRTVAATLMSGEPMEMRIAGAMRQLREGSTLQVTA